ncbi:hypothetical protein DF268_08585 [Streptomyces sp. V2]|uniref:hypothetical protein n=1 Tax=Streptomyces sp. V2 TaxID=1424099 RepID=UPI000D669896|nr:hypothetical protein [Streptomyces sp. V2]PWG13913.1 hypothetical protein DF268_08585 [Streptomyces sp. V2]
MIIPRRQMAALAVDREIQADRALADANTYPDDSAERRLATQCANELRDHADQLRRGINPYEEDHTLWIPTAGDL